MNEPEPVPVKNKDVAMAAPTKDTAVTAVPYDHDASDGTAEAEKAPVAPRSPERKFNPGPG